MHRRETADGRQVGGLRTGEGRDKLLADQTEAILDVWYGFVASTPELVFYFKNNKTGAPDGAYLGAVPLFGNRDLAKAAASILGDEAMHWAILRQAMGEAPVPVAFMS